MRLPRSLHGYNMQRTNMSVCETLLRVGCTRLFVCLAQFPPEWFHHFSFSLFTASGVSTYSFSAAVKKNKQRA